MDRRWHYLRVTDQEVKNWWIGPSRSALGFFIPNVHMHINQKVVSNDTIIEDYIFSKIFRKPEASNSLLFIFIKKN